MATDPSDPKPPSPVRPAAEIKAELEAELECLAEAQREREKAEKADMAAAISRRCVHLPGLGPTWRQNGRYRYQPKRRKPDTDDVVHTATLANFVADLIEDVRFLDDENSNLYKLRQSLPAPPGEVPKQRLLHIRKSDFFKPDRLAEILSGPVSFDPTKIKWLQQAISNLSDPPRIRIGTVCVGQVLSDRDCYIFRDCVIEDGEIRPNESFVLHNDGDRAVQRYNLPIIDEDLLPAIAQGILTQVIPLHVPSVMLPLLGLAALAPIQRRLRGHRFAAQCFGSTGAAKTLCVKVVLNFYADYSLILSDDTTGLPSFSSTINALEMTAWKLPGLLTPVDDLKAEYLVGSKMRDVIRFIQGIYDATGRGRMTSDAAHRGKEYFARGLVVFTGEEAISSVQSVSERMLMINVPDLTPEQQAALPGKVRDIEALRPDLRGLMAHYIAWTQRQPTIALWTPDADTVLHHRISNYVRQVVTGLKTFLAFLVDGCAVDQTKADAIFEEGISVITAIGASTVQESREETIAHQYLSGVRQLIASKRAYLLNEGSADEFPPAGERIGMVKDGVAYLLDGASVQMINSVCRKRLSVKAVGHALAEAGLLVATDHDRKQKRMRIDGVPSSTFAIASRRIWGEEGDGE